MKKRNGMYYALLLFVCLFTCHRIYGQENPIVSSVILQPSLSAVSDDTIPTIYWEEEEWDHIFDIRKQFEKQNKTYSAPTVLSPRLSRLLRKNKLDISDEAKYWAHLKRDPSELFDHTKTFRDTMVVNPLFLPIVFRGDYLPKNLRLYDPDTLRRKKNPYDRLCPMDSIFPDIARRKEFEELAYKYVRNNYPAYFRYSERDLPHEFVKPDFIEKNIYEDLLFKVEADTNVDDVDAPARFIPKRKYWESAFESAIQFSQNYVSDNWYNGGSSNFNLYTKNTLQYNYKKDKVQVSNLLEIKANIYTAPEDSLHTYKISDDGLRLYSNVGYQAFNKWYYSFDAEFKTQFFTSYAENSTTKQAAFLAPFSLNFGVGMKYELEKPFSSKHKNIKLTLNLAPLAYTYMYSRQEIDYSRHGFELKDGSDDEYDNRLSQLGSTIRSEMTFNINRNVSWQSRFYYFTTYKRVVGEFENTLVMAISRFFSTRIYFHLRFDDGVDRDEGESYFQFNELLSFGFNYKW